MNFETYFSEAMGIKFEKFDRKPVFSTNEMRQFNKIKDKFVDKVEYKKDNKKHDLIIKLKSGDELIVRKSVIDFGKEGEVGAHQNAFYQFALNGEIFKDNDTNSEFPFGSMIEDLNINTINYWANRQKPHYNGKEKRLK